MLKMENRKPSYSPGEEPSDIKKLLDVFLADVDKKFPDGTIVWSEWNHEKWDKPAGFLCNKLGYSRGAEFLRAYGYEIVKEREPKPEKKPDDEENIYEARRRERSSASRHKQQRQSEAKYVQEPKKKNRPLLVISCVVLVIALLAVGGAFFYLNRSGSGLNVGTKRESGPDSTIIQFCDAMKAFDLDKMHSLVLSSDQSWGQLEENDMAIVFIDSMKEWSKKMSYSIGNTDVDGDHANVSVNYKYTDATDVVKSTLREYLTQAFGMVLDNPSEEQMTQLLTEIFKDQTTKTPTVTAEASVVYPCSKVNGNWMIDTVPEEAVNVLSNNIIKVFDEFSNIDFG